MNHSDQPAASDATVRRLGAYLAAAACGALAGLVLVLLAVRWLGPGALPPVTEERFLAAQELWRHAGPSSYDLEVVVAGRERATFSVEVRGGNVEAARRNGQPLKQQRTWTTWTVPGMYETIARDLETVARGREERATAAASQLILRGTFDAERGFPVRYQRTEIHKFAPNQEVIWEVTQFQGR
jgi:hypothetical protein